MKIQSKNTLKVSNNDNSLSNDVYSDELDEKQLTIGIPTVLFDTDT